MLPHRSGEKEMIFLYSIFFIVGIIAFFLLHSLAMPKRLILSVIIFAVPALVLTLALLKGGDKPLPGSRTISPEELERERN